LPKYCSAGRYAAKEIEKFVDELRVNFNGYPNAKIQVKQFEQGPPIDALLPYDFR
jgi:hypothetical protein